MARIYFASVETTSLRNAGPRITVGAAPTGSGNFVPVKSVLDTGADFSGLHKRVIQELNLKVVDRRPVAHQGGITENNFYDVQVRFPDDDQSVSVRACEMDDPQFDMIIGRDVLSRTILLYDGVSGTYVLIVYAAEEMSQSSHVRIEKSFSALQQVMAYKKK